MNEAFQYLDILILAVLAGLVLLRLRSVLGRRTGNEKTDTSSFNYEATNTESKVEPSIKIPPVDRNTSSGDSWFNSKDFLNGANKAYELIVINFENGNKKELTPFLEKSVLSNFSEVIDQRQQDNHTVEFSFIGIESSEIVHKDLKNDPMEVTVRFISEMITCIRNNKDEIISGSMNQVQKITDVWTFTKNKKIKSDNWLLSATSD
ncbi:MAG: Tim44/TimA family putative adaptor protein [Pelagibacterales bacterium]|nr:Tim44/TimA family putative adaptor protein [Pelagibacterales bacterium]